MPRAGVAAPRSLQGHGAGWESPVDLYSGQLGPRRPRRTTASEVLSELEWVDVAVGPRAERVLGRPVAVLPIEEDGNPKGRRHSGDI